MCKELIIFFSLIRNFNSYANEANIANKYFPVWVLDYSPIIVLCHSELSQQHNLALGCFVIYAWKVSFLSSTAVTGYSFSQNNASGSSVHWFQSAKKASGEVTIACSDIEQTFSASKSNVLGLIC